MRRFEIKHASYLLEDGIKVLGLCDHPTSPSRMLIIQDALSYDEQDVELGMDKCCFEFTDGKSEGVFYADLDRATLEYDRLRLTFPATEKESQDLCQDAEVVWKTSSARQIGGEILKFFEGQTCFEVTSQEVKEEVTEDA